MNHSDIPTKNKVLQKTSEKYNRNGNPKEKKRKKSRSL